ncbi:MAG: CAP domain-containing protein [Thermoleophilia bacterium]|nr:CAP domain-containing protein [Thermoleophilia bacterium]
MATIVRSALLAALLAAAALALPAAPGVAGPGSPRPRAVVDADALEPAVVARINKVRRRHGLKPLRASGALAKAAGRHARSMARGGYFSHTSRDGTQPSTRIRRYYAGSAVGETLLWRSPGLTAAQAVRMWLASPPHRSILLSSAFREIGLAAVRAAGAPGAFRGLDVTIVVADFGAP